MTFPLSVYANQMHCRETARTQHSWHFSNYCSSLEEYGTAPWANCINRTDSSTGKWRIKCVSGKTTPLLLVYFFAFSLRGKFLYRYWRYTLSLNHPWQRERCSFWANDKVYGFKDCPCPVDWYIKHGECVNATTAASSSSRLSLSNFSLVSLVIMAALSLNHG